MPPNPFAVRVRYATPGRSAERPIAIIDLSGEISSEAETGLNAAYTEATNTTAEAIVLNFGGVSYINSTGIALIVKLLAHAHGAGRPMLVYGLSDHYVEIFQITRLASYMHIFADEASALASVAA